MFAEWLLRNAAAAPFRRMLEEVDHVADPVARRLAFEGIYRAAQHVYAVGHRDPSTSKLEKSDGSRD